MHFGNVHSSSRFRKATYMLTLSFYFCALMAEMKDLGLD